MKKCFWRYFAVKRQIAVFLLVALLVASLTLVLLSRRGIVCPAKKEITRSDASVDPLLVTLIDSGDKVFSQRRIFGWHRWVLHGQTDIYNSEGKRIGQISYKNGIWDGPTISWHDNGVVASKESYCNGREFGKATNWSRSGRKVRELFYYEGYKEGSETYWNEDGNTTVRISWAHGEPVHVEIYSDGNVIERLSGKEAKDRVDREFMSGVPDE